MDQPLPLDFPRNGLAVSRGHSEQQPLTTAKGSNVRTFDSILFRARGGSRPGLSRYIAQQIPGYSAKHAIQNLSVVVRADYSALPPTNLNFPPTNLILDPTSIGPPSSWGNGILYFDPNTGQPVTGTTLGTRVPGGGDGSARKVPKNGSGFQPNKNVLTAAAPPGVAPKRLFSGLLTIQLQMNAPDPFHFDGQKPTFTGVECRYYNPPTIPAPSDATTFASVIAQRDAFLALATVAPWLKSYVVIGNSVTGPGGSCNVVGTDH